MRSFRSQADEAGLPMPVKGRSTGATAYATALGLAVAVGAALRLYLLPSQILLDDEWHGLNQVIDASFSDLLGSADARDNTSLPLNIYHWVLLHTAGWNEFTIRLPVILAGLLGLVLMPLAARNVVGDRTARIFAALLAIAPFAIFYSRFSRAYGITLLLSFLALLSAHRWLATGDRRAVRGFLATGTIAAYFHPFAAIVIAVPFVVYAAGTMAGATGGRTGNGARPGPGPGEILRTGLIQAALLVPALWVWWTAEAKLPWGEGSWSWPGAADLLGLLAGSARAWLTVPFYGFLLLGAVALRRTAPLLAGMFAATVVLYISALTLSRPFGLGNGVVALRYAIVLLPIGLVCVAAGVDALWTRLTPLGSSRSAVALPSAVVGGMILALFLGGPLPAIYASPNNFTGHSAYQGSYAPLNRERSEARHVYPGHSVTAADLPEYYARLRDRGEIGTIIEYPFDVTNYNNLFYYYQRVHGKRVIAGYCADRTLLGHRAELPAGDEGVPLRLGMLTADQILHRVDEPRRLKFANMADVTDPRPIAASGASVVVLHKFVTALRFLPGGTDAIRVRYRSVPLLAGRLAAAFGPPEFEDESIICFRVKIK